jgi:hypothetical protein
VVNKTCRARRFLAPASEGSAADGELPLDSANGEAMPAAASLTMAVRAGKLDAVIEKEM